ncbi:MAG TPA: molecular chaperone DnaJ, partial [Phycisphaeraceae bacterium]
EIERGASKADVKKSYLRLARKYHPDVNKETGAEARFKEITEAYEVLSDDEKRRRYDQFGHAGLRGTSGHDFSTMDVGDIFSIFEDIFGGNPFGGGGRRRRRQAQRGYDLETQIQITLEDVAKGAEREIEFTRQDLCSTCEGTGAKPGSEPVTCVTCGGTGQVAQSGFSGMFRMVTTCPACGGAGRVIRDRCPQCKGSGRQPKRRVLTVKIPPGIHDGQAIRIPGEGEPGSPGGLRGDLHVVVRVTPHELFAREDDHLILRMPISFTQAALGAKVKVPTLNGHQQELTIHAGTQHGEMFRIPGQGLPNLRTGQRGDLVVILLLEIPKKLTAEQEELLRRFAQTENHEVMPQSRGFWEKIKAYLS